MNSIRYYICLHIESRFLLQYLAAFRGGELLHIRLQGLADHLLQLEGTGLHLVAFFGLVEFGILHLAETYLGFGEASVYIDSQAHRQRAFDEFEMIVAVVTLEVDTVFDNTEVGMSVDKAR